MTDTIDFTPVDLSEITKSITEKARVYNEQMKVQREAFQKELLKQFYEGTKSIFEAYPGLDAFTWEQGTSSFCDGDPCHFHVQTDTEFISINVDPKYAEFTDGITEGLEEQDLDVYTVTGQETYMAKEYRSGWAQRRGTNESPWVEVERQRDTYTYIWREGMEEFKGVFKLIAGFLGAFSEEVYESFADPDYPSKITLYRDGTVDVTETEWG